MNCPHYLDGCLLGYHGGKPLVGNCRACIEAGENNEASAKALFELVNVSHPPTKQRISGCCDSALNPPLV